MPNGLKLREIVKKTIRMKLFLSVLLSIGLLFGGLAKSNPNPPDEGMWLPLLLKDYNYEEMKKLGCKLTPDQIYSVNNSSLKDAIVQLGGFCTAEVVSAEGLLFTNHHCAYDAIQEHSSVENDFLTDGFWAMNRSEELQVPGLTVTFLQYMEDITAELDAVKDGKSEAEAELAVNEKIEALKDAAIAGTDYRAEVKSMFDGNAHYLFVYRTYRDVRLVGAPPSSIGKFGGDTDNWMWPRHTGDFSILRVYAGEDNEPVDYSSTNKPYKPKHFLPVNVNGIDEGDYTMIMGYPGSTDRYFTSYEVSRQQEIVAPAIVKILGERLRIMKEEMDKDAEVRIMLASSYASLNNTYKYFKGNLRSLKKFNLSAEKRKMENEYLKWAAQEKEREKYSASLKGIGELINNTGDVAKLNYYMQMAGFAPSVVGPAIQMWRLKLTMDAAEDESDYEDAIEGLKERVDEIFKEYHAGTDERILGLSARLLYDLPKEQRPDFFESKLYSRATGVTPFEKCNSMASRIYRKSIIADPEKFAKFLEKPKLKKLEKDPGLNYFISIINCYRQNVLPGQNSFQGQLSDMRQTYMEGLMKMNPDKKFYPDANFTLRLTYGTVQNYSGWDGESFNTFTYATEILDKEIPNDDEFHVPGKLKELIQKQDYGQYANEKGRLPVCFLHNTDITGGNSGSPVINGNGELVGIAFDGNWESMMSDLKFQDEYVRTISVDVRYVLFVIDKFAGASHLIDELKLVE